jgi:hypothetical protein
MELWHLAVYSAVIVFACWALVAITGRSRPPRWVSNLPEQLQPEDERAFGSTQLEDGRGNCGAIVYSLATEQADQFRRGGIFALPTGMVASNGAFRSWRNTPVSDVDFNRYIANPASKVGLNCSHGTWEKDWHAAAIAPGNFYAENGKAMILIDMNAATARPNVIMPVGYFYNP